MTYSAHIFWVIGELALPFVMFLLFLIVFRSWAEAVGDLVWMVCLRPKLVITSLTVTAFAIGFGAHVAIGDDYGSTWNLSIGFMLLLTPIFGKWFANFLARWDFRIFPEVFSFRVDLESSPQITVFALDTVARRFSYIPPRSRPLFEMEDQTENTTSTVRLRRRFPTRLKLLISRLNTLRSRTPV